MASAELVAAVRAVNQASSVLRDVTRDVDTVGRTAEHVGGGPLRKLSGALGDVAKIASGFVIGAGLLKLPGFLSSAAQGAADDEAAMLRLEQAVRNTGYAFEDAGNIFDEVIRAGQNLAFTDDQIRDSLVTLLNATGDVTEAEKRHTAALDLARGAGISLEQATKLLSKANEENADVLKRLGINLKDGATETELLLAVQQKFGGQAATFANTAAGRWERFKIKLGELKETIGTALLPMFLNLASGVERAADFLGPFVERFADFSRHVLDLVGSGLVAVFEAIKGPLVEIGGIVWDGFRAAWDAVSAAVASVDWAAVGGAFLHIGQVAWEKVQPALSAIGDAFSSIDWKAIGRASLDTENWAAAWDGLVQKVQPAIDFLKPLVEGLLDALADHFRRVGGALRDELLPALQPLLPALKPLAEIIGTVFVLQIGAALKALELFTRFITEVVVLAINALALEIRGLTLVVTEVINFFTTVGPKAAEAIGDLSTTLFQKGKDLIQGLWDGIIWVWELVRAQFIAIGDTIIGFFRDAGTWLYEAGRNVIQGFWDGLKSKFGDLKDWATSNLDPRNWDIPGLSPFVPAMEHAGQLGGQAFGNGMVSALLAAGPAIEGAAATVAAGVQKVLTVTPIIIPGAQPSGNPGFDTAHTPPGTPVITPEDALDRWRQLHQNVPGVGYWTVDNINGGLRWVSDPTYGTDAAQGLSDALFDFQSRGGSRASSSGVNVTVNVGPGAYVQDLSGFVRELRRELGREIA